MCCEHCCPAASGASITVNNVKEIATQVSKALEGATLRIEGRSLALKTRGA